MSEISDTSSETIDEKRMWPRLFDEDALEDTPLSEQPLPLSDAELQLLRDKRQDLERLYEPAFLQRDCHIRFSFAVHSDELLELTATIQAEDGTEIQSYTASVLLKGIKELPANLLCSKMSAELEAWLGVQTIRHCMRLRVSRHSRLPQ